MALITPPPGAIEELNSWRTQFSKTYRMNGRENKQIIHRRPVHVPGDIAAYRKGGFPDFQDIDTDLELRPEGYCIKNGWYECCIEVGRIAWRYTSKLDGIVHIELARIGSQIVSELPLQFNPVLVGNTLTFPAILPGLDIQFIARASGLFCNKILRSTTVPRVFGWRIECSKDCPLQINTTTQGYDNYGLQDLDRQSAGKGDVCRRIEMQHSVVDATPNELAVAQIFTETWTGRTFTHDMERRLQPQIDCVYPVLIDQDIIQPITANLDDGYGISGYTTWYYNNAINYFGYASGTGNSYYGGWRFPLAVPQASVITLAELIVNVTSVIGAGNSFDVFAEDVDDAAAFADTTRLPQNIAPITTASGTHTFTSTGLQTANVTSVVQEIVSRPGFTSGNNIAFVHRNLANTGPATDAGYWEDYSNVGTNESVLEVTFTSPIGANIVPRTMPIGWLRRF